MATDLGAASGNAGLTCPPLNNFTIELHVGHINAPDVNTLNPLGPCDASFVDPSIGTTLQTQVAKTNLVTGVGIRFTNPA